MTRPASILAGLFLIAAAAPALAQDGGDPVGTGGGGSNWTVNLGAATDNRSRELSKTDGDPFVYAEAEWTSDDGLYYVQPGIETIRADGSRVETELVAGFRPQVAGFDLDLNVAYKYRLDVDPGVDDTGLEFSAQAERSIGPVGGRLIVEHAPDATGAARAWTWIAARLAYDLTDRLELSGQAGHRDQSGAPSYVGWNAGLNYAFNPTFGVDLRYHANDENEPDEQFSDTLVLSLDVSF